LKRPAAAKTRAKNRAVKAPGGSGGRAEKPVKQKKRKKNEVCRSGA